LRYIKDLLVTEDVLIRGHVATGGRRLTDFLNATPRIFLDVDEASVAGHGPGEGMKQDSLLVRVDDVLLAHELVEAGGDQSLKALAHRGRDLGGIRLELGSRLRLTVTGKVIRRLLTREDLGAARFFVVEDPVISGFPTPDGSAPDTLRGLPYIIVNRPRISLAFRVGD
jgi:hypothetical protein